MIEPGLPSEIVKKFPSNVCEFLQLNRNCDKKFVARAKIFKNHFDGDFDLHLFQSMKVKILPHVLQWVGGDCAVEDKEECDVNSIPLEVKMLKTMIWTRVVMKVELTRPDLMTHMEVKLKFSGRIGGMTIHLYLMVGVKDLMRITEGVISALQDRSSTGFQSFTVSSGTYLWC